MSNLGKWLNASLLMLFMIISGSCAGCGGDRLIEPPAQQYNGPTGSVEGYIYAPVTAARTGARYASDGTQSYEPLSDAAVTVTCSGVSKTTTTNTDGFYEIEEIPVGDCRFVASKQGYTNFEKQVEIAENETSTMMTTTDGKLLGLSVIEDVESHTGTTVTIIQGIYSTTRDTDERGLYVFPDLSNFSDGEVEIDALNTCEYYLPVSSTVQITNGSVLNNRIPKMTLPLLLKYEIALTFTKDGTTTIETTGEVITLVKIINALTISYRGDIPYTVSSSHLNPEIYHYYPQSDVVSVASAWPAASRSITFSSENRVFIDTYTTNDAATGPDKEVYMQYGDEELPACAQAIRIKQYSIPPMKPYKLNWADVLKQLEDE